MYELLAPILFLDDIFCVIQVNKCSLLQYTQMIHLSNLDALYSTPCNCNIFFTIQIIRVSTVQLTWNPYLQLGFSSTGYICQLRMCRRHLFLSYPCTNLRMRLGIAIHFCVCQVSWHNHAYDLYSTLTLVWQKNVVQSIFTLATLSMFTMASCCSVQLHLSWWVKPLNIWVKTNMFCSIVLQIYLWFTHCGS